MSRKRKSDDRLFGNKKNRECEKSKKSAIITEVIKSKEQKTTNVNKIVLSAKTPNQKEVLKSLWQNRITFITGPAGTGKTYISSTYGLMELMKGRYERMILTRPCVEAYGESLGYLPGDANSKIMPYMMPMMDVFGDHVDPKMINKFIEDGMISMVPLAFMRGRSFKNTFIMADECLEYNTKVKILLDGKKRNMPIGRIGSYIRKGKNVFALSVNSLGQEEYKKITSFFENGEKEIIDIYTSLSKCPIKITKNHPVAVFEEGNILWKESNDLREGDVLFRHKNKQTNNASFIMSKNYDILLGFILGDGCISVNKSNQKGYRLSKTHSIKQYDYMKFCMSLFDYSYERKGLVSGYTKKPLCGFNTKTIFIDRKFIDSCYYMNKKCIKEDIRKYITERTLAIWYMDDGGIHTTGNSKPYIRLHTEGFSLEENQILSGILLEKFGLKSKIRPSKGKYYYIEIGTESSEKFLDIIKDLVHPNMMYKNPKSVYFDDKKYGICNAYNNSTPAFIKKINKENKKSFVYNIEVEDNNNYYAKNILVHNCQNAVKSQVMLLLTRLGENSKMVITGDLTQSDLQDEMNGLKDAVVRFTNTEGMGIINLEREDIVRDPMVQIIVDKYEKENKKEDFEL